LTEVHDYVFTDYDVKVDLVLKNNAGTNIETNGSIVVSSGGGAVKVRDRIIRFADQSYAQYKKGKRYLFFLKYVSDAAVYQGAIDDNSFALHEDRVDVKGNPHYEELGRQIFNRSADSLIEQTRQAASHCR
jgi:hypothetical protein